VGDPGQDSHRARFAVVRAPLLAFDELVRWADGAQALRCGTDGSPLRTALAADRALLRARLREAVARPEVREAIFLASPGLLERVDAWMRDPDVRRAERVERALVRYYARMAGRATPFGLFAAYQVAAVEARSALDIGGLNRVVRRTRLDTEFLDTLALSLEADRSIRSGLTFRANSSLYRAGGRLCIVQARRLAGRRTFHVIAIDETPAIALVIQRARRGAGVRPLAEALVAQDVGLAEAEEFVHQLIDEQVLVSSLQPAVTGREAVMGIIDALSCTDAGAETARVLRRAQEEMGRLDAAGVGIDESGYRSIAAGLGALGDAGNLARVFQVDCARPAGEIVVHEEVTREALRAVAALHRIGGNGADGLDEFRRRFVERFEHRPVPLLLALDPDTGVGFEVSDDGGAELWKRIGSRVSRLIHYATSGALDEIRLTDEDLAALAAPGTLVPLPPTLGVLGALAAPSPAAVERGAFRFVLRGVSTTGAGRLLGRFCGGDARLRELVRAHVEVDERFAAPAIVGDVVHLPQGRMGNVLSRPLLRSLQLEFLGRSDADADGVLPVSDLLVNVENGRIVLRAAADGREIIPSLLSAHAFTAPDQLPVYQFLGTLQRQHAPPLRWAWGPFANLPALPRVVIGRTVVARRQWYLEADEIARMALVAEDQAFTAVQAWRRAQRVPRFVVFAKGDNELPFDLDNALAVHTLCELLRTEDRARLFELNPVPEELAVEGAGGRFVHEILIPFEATHLAAVAPSWTPRPRSAPVRRTFAPGSEWLYLKLYAGPVALERLLRSPVTDLVRRAVEEGAASHWFFLRYWDPSPHIRLRLRGDPAALLSRVLPRAEALAARHMATDALWKLQVDTYEREVERYGGPEAIEAVESVFMADSQAVLAILQTPLGPETADTRLLLAMGGVDALLGDFGMDSAAKVAFALAQSALSTADRRAASAVHRRERHRIEPLFGRDRATSEFAAAVAAWDLRGAAIRPHVETLRGLEEDGRLTMPLRSVVASLAHMHVNRVLRMYAPETELRIYALLERAQRAVHARGA
jgi:lantibiotic biosynthesis protein